MNNLTGLFRYRLFKFNGRSADVLSRTDNILYNSCSGTCVHSLTNAYIVDYNRGCAEKGTLAYS